MKTDNAKIKSGLITSVIFGSILIFAVITVLIGVSFGSKNINMADCLHIILGKTFHFDLDENLSRDVTILWNMRMPRMLLALAAGGGFGGRRGAWSATSASSSSARERSGVCVSEGAGNQASSTVPASFPAATTFTSATPEA